MGLFQQREWHRKNYTCVKFRVELGNILFTTPNFSQCRSDPSIYSAFRIALLAKISCHRAIV